MSDERVTQATPVQFLHDTVADKDFLGSHQRVASGIAAAICDNPTLKVVGILGPWGSGKSTVVRLVEQALEHAPVPHRVFTYDAWLHQSDPPRRAFLERFLEFLVARKRVTAEAYKVPMDVLNRRIEDTQTTTTPFFTTAGHLLLLSLALVPMGTRFLGADWYGKFIDPAAGIAARLVFPAGIALTLAPLLAASFIYLWWRPVRKPFRRSWRPFNPEFFNARNLTIHREPHVGSSLLALMVNKQVQAVNSRVVKTPEPTTIEFQKIFRDMLRDGHKAGERIVIVVDNLDRLPEAAAVGMWTTIRSFFLGTIAESDLPTAAAMPTVLLPIDDKAVARLYRANGADELDLARSFMDKTFDLTFHVNGPVLSDWNAYLSQLLRQVLGDEIAEEWSFEVSRLYAKKGVVRITPRDLNRQVNAIAALWLQWRAELPFPTVAYYAIFRTQLDENLLEAIAKPVADISEHDPEWTRNLAAIHFGLPPIHAIQVMLAPQLVASIQERDREAFAVQLGIRGVGQVLVDLVSGERHDFDFLSNLAELLDDVEPQDFATKQVWRQIRRAYRQAAFSDTLDAEGAALPAMLLKHGTEAEREMVLKGIAEKANQYRREMVQIVGHDDRLPEKIGAVLAVWHDAARQHPTPPVIELHDTDVYLHVAARIIDGDRPSDLIRARPAGSALASALARSFAQLSAEDAGKQAAVVLSLDPGPKGLDDLLQAAQAVLDDSEASAAQADVAMDLMGKLRRRHAPAQERIAQLASNGQLQERIQRAYMWSTRLAARIGALLILEQQRLPLPEEQNWDDYLDRHTDFAEHVDIALIAYGDGEFLSQLAYQYSRTDENFELVSQIVARRVAAGDLGRFDAAAVIANKEPYWNTVALRDEPAFYALVVRDRHDWDTLAELDFDQSATRIYEALIQLPDDGATRRKARSALRKALKTIATDRWQQQISQDGSLIELAAKLQALDRRPIAIGTRLFEALQAQLGPLTESADEKFCSRWFQSASLLSAAGHRTILANLRDRLNMMDEVPNLLRLLKAGGVDLLKTAGFETRADEAVRHVLAPLISDNEGILWLAEHSIAIADWVKRANGSTQQFLNERMGERYELSEDTAKALLNQLYGDWKLDRTPTS